MTLQVKMEHKKEVQHGKHSRPPSDEGGGAEGDGGRDFLYLNTPTNPNLTIADASKKKRSHEMGTRANEGFSDVVVACP